MFEFKSKDRTHLEGKCLPRVHVAIGPAPSVTNNSKYKGTSLPASFNTKGFTRLFTNYSNIFRLKFATSGLGIPTWLR